MWLHYGSCRSNWAHAARLDLGHLSQAMRERAAAATPAQLTNYSCVAREHARMHVCVESVALVDSTRACMHACVNVCMSAGARIRSQWEVLEYIYAV